MDWKQLIEPLLKSIILFVEASFVRRTGGPATSQAKFGAAVNLTQSALVAAASTGAIPLADAHNLLAIADKVREHVEVMKDMGMLGGQKGGAEVSPPSTFDLRKILSAEGK